MNIKRFVVLCNLAASLAAVDSDVHDLVAEGYTGLTQHQLRTRHRPTVLCQRLSLALLNLAA